MSISLRPFSWIPLMLNSVLRIMLFSLSVQEDAAVMFMTPTEQSVDVIRCPCAAVCSAQIPAASAAAAI